MIIIYHNGSKIIGEYRADTQSSLDLKQVSIATFLIYMANKYPDDLLIWCHVQMKSVLNISDIEQLFHHKKIVASYNPCVKNYLDSRIGYVEESPFIRINKSVPFPTWQMSSWVGGIHSATVLALTQEMPLNTNFDYFLTSLAKLGMSNGLLCYSEPRLLIDKPKSFSTQTSYYTLFRFVKQHYKIQWVFLLLFNMLVYERKFPIIPFLFSFFYKIRNNKNLKLDSIKVVSSKEIVVNRTLDVVIPTIGRKEYLHNVLKDFAKQTLLPKTIIIVEQNPVEGSKSELNYIKKEKWPFEIKHFFTHQAGACNARNIALEQVKSEWVFLADDDNSFEATLISEVFDAIEQYGVSVVTTAYPQKKEIKKQNQVFQCPTFGAGNSFVKRTLLEDVKFNIGYEFGYGEDVDFGMQLRNQGQDILYLPEPMILHLKAPIGGFRTKPVLQWQNDNIQPKPSPTIMLCQMLHHTPEQIKSYKTILFFKYYNHQKIKNPISYYIYFIKQWGRSVFWANKLKQQNEI